MCRANLNKPTKVELNSFHSFFPSCSHHFSKLLDTLGVVVFKCQSTFVVSSDPLPHSHPPPLSATFQQAAQIHVTRRHLARCAAAENVGECTAAGGISFYNSFSFFFFFIILPATPFSIICLRALTCATHCRTVSVKAIVLRNLFGLHSA